MAPKKQGPAAKPPAQGDAPASPKASKSRRPSPTAASDAAPQLSSFQKFEPRRMHRRELKGFPRNPRVISDESKAWLKKKLQTRGLLKALVWNEITGQLVEGHQRLAVLDALEGHDNYLLDVVVVRLSADEEVEENIAFNGGKTGDWDHDLLADLLKTTPGLELENIGLDFADVQVMFEDPDLASLFAPNEPTKAALSEVEKQQKASETKKRRQQQRATDGAAYDETQDTETNPVVLFRTRAERERFVELLGYGPDERYVDGARLMERLDAKRSP